MKLGGDSRAVYRKIISEIERSGVKRDRIGKLKLMNSPEKILQFQNWLKSLPVCDGELPELSLSIKPDMREVYLSSEELVNRLKKYGFLAEVSSSNGVMVGCTFIRFESEVETLEKACRKDSLIDICRIVCPEKVVEPFVKSLSALQSYFDFLRSCGVEASNTGAIISAAREVKSAFKKVRDSSMIEEIVMNELVELNERIEREIADFEVTLRGRSILDAMRGDVSGIPFHEVENVIAEKVIESEKRVGELTGVDVSGLFSQTYPVEVNENVLERIVDEVDREVKLELYRACRKAANTIAERIEGFKREVELAQDIEFSSKLKKFGWTFPEIADYTAFVEGENLFIDNPQPVTYSIGDSPIAKGRIVILTGANSGGKTSLLELVAQVQIMGQMGLPVRAKKAWINVFDGIYFFRRKKGSVGAGAFESAVRAFVRAIVSGGRNLILVDEFEAITEPGAAVSIMAELLKIASERGHYVIVVSHLGNELKEELPFARVDGIEAKGLDENFNLVVDRQPVFGKPGRSTPELIIEKMYMKARGGEKNVLERILNHLKSRTASFSSS